MREHQGNTALRSEKHGIHATVLIYTIENARLNYCKYRGIVNARKQGGTFIYNQWFLRKANPMGESNSLFQNGLEDLFSRKPDLVARIPEWLLPPDKKEKYKSMGGLAIVELAGRDSVAAAVKSVSEEGFSDLLPIYVYTGTEYGEWRYVGLAAKRLAERLPDVRVHDMLIIGAPDFWRALNGRFVSDLISKFGFYSPCIGCHLYLHTARIPIAIELGGKPIISGERELHDGSVKINQISEALDAYLGIGEKFGVRFLFPLRKISSGRIVEDILMSDWKQGKEQLKCCLSGNYALAEGGLNITAGQISDYLEKFAIPCAEKILAGYLSGHIPDHAEMAKNTPALLSAPKPRT